MPSRFRRKIIDQAFYDRGCLKEFCEETSLAGFKYLLPQYGPTIRRILWSCVCLAFTIITIYQLTQQIMGYINTPLAVDISKEYPDDLSFPVVVICNSMPYRVSKVRPQSDMHQAFSEMYRTPKLNAQKALDHKLLLSKYKDTRDYLEKIAFDKKDMIVQCVWKHDEACSADDFDIEIVDSRICYSFNTGKNGTRRIDHAGEANGLELTLNIETYERMQGPYTTFGAMVSFFPQNQRPSLQGAVNTLIGASTKIGLRQKQIQYYKGETCDEKPLKYYEIYSRSSCILERQIQAVTNECECLPFIVNGTKAFGNVSSCNLFEHFYCADHKLGEAPTVGEGDCPKECDVISYEASVSQSIIAWDQAQSTLRGDYAARTDMDSSDNLDEEQSLRAMYATHVQLDKKLLTATEIRHRFDPDNNRTTASFVKGLRAATANVTALMMDINNMTCYEDLDIPAGDTVPGIAESFESLESYLISSETALVTTVNEKLIKINESIYEALFLFGNETYLDYILTNSNVSEDDTLESLELPPEYFTVSEETLYLNTLKKWIEAIGGIKELHKDFNKSMTGLSKNWRFIMSKNDSLLFNHTRNKILDVGFKSGCLDVPYQVEILDENTTRTDYLVDLVSCFHYYYSSNNLKQIQALAMVQAVSFLTENHAETEVQETMCTKLLCRVINEVDGHNCTLNSDSLIKIIPEILTTLEPVVSNCSEQLELAKAEMEEFIIVYKNATLPAFNDLTKKMIGYKTEADIVRLRLADPIWPIDSSLGFIEGNISNFEYNGVNYKSLAENVTNIHAEYLESTFPYTANEARSRLQALLESLTKLDEYTEAFYVSMDSFTMEEKLEGYGIFEILANSLLWKNETTDRLAMVSDCSMTIRNLTTSYLNRLPAVQTSYKQRGERLITLADSYLKDLEMDNSFFNKNFMVVSIYFHEISNDFTLQRSSYDFWSLMADVGGASGLWLGFCMVTLVEFFEMFIRHIVCSASKYVYVKHKTKIDGAIDNAKKKSYIPQFNGTHGENGDVRNGEKGGGVNNFNLDDVWDGASRDRWADRTKL